MTKREEIDQLRHDYFMLSRRVEMLEHRLSGLLADAPKDSFQLLNGKTMGDIQRDWNERHSSVLAVEKGQSPKIKDMSKGHWIPTPSDSAPKPYAHPNCED
jgi:K+/H+ antiporter YhaU regulatory subunit KhtT